jgi:heme-degrading monooxygenase HmoA
MANVWTHGAWTVEPGREDEFVAAWRDMASSAMAEFSPPEPPRLLRDREHSNVFLTFGPWESIEQIERFRSSALFSERVASMGELLESFETRTLDEVGLGD